ncbi:P-loop containing nucleoside triphosphate hydrolase protein [Chytriomyces cf. hyalinus JEL632]|nr:P-loop containing nucleoside triphosphate hydrolase protein [Chytriomyces cf. hyalinus JEL632]
MHHKLIHRLSTFFIVCSVESVLSGVQFLSTSHEISGIFAQVQFVSKLALVAIVLSLAGLSIYQTSCLEDESIHCADETLKESGTILVSPEPQTLKNNYFSFLYFTWMNPLMRLGSKRPLKMGDLPHLSETEKAQVAVENYKFYKAKYSTLFWSIFASESRSFGLQFIFSVCSTSLGLSGPYFLYRITGEIQSPSASPAKAFVFATCFGLSSIGRAMFNNHAWHLGRKSSMRIKAVLVNEIYSKSLRRIPAVGAATNPAAVPGEESVAAKKPADEDATVGKIVTLMSTDAETIRDNLPEMYDLVIMPLQCAAAIIGLLYVIGWPALAGLAVMILTLPATYLNSQWYIRVYDKLLAAQDARTTVVNEVLQGIRIIKYFAWEKKFLEKIDAARNKEMTTLIESYFNGAVNTFIWLMTPIIVSFITLFTLTKIAGKDLDAQMAFTCLSLFNNLRVPLMAIPYIIADIFRLRVAFGRLAKFLNQDELEKYSSNSAKNLNTPTNTALDAPVIGFKAGWFKWHTASSIVVEDSTSSNAAATESTALLSSQPQNDATNADPDSGNASFTLRELNVTFPTGVLTAVCGATGAGKSSLLQALLGEMKRISGDAYLPNRRISRTISTSDDDYLNGSVAYVAQTSWLQNATIRDNITFGEDYDAVRYDRVIKACALVKDLETLDAGDLTEIGEKGINLSGGQKQRVSLARAIYSRASFILLDDPLSAVDAPTARHLFEKAICGPLMKNRTRILVTHATSLVLKNGNTQFLVAIQSGSVVAAGPVADAMKVPGVASIVGFSEISELKSQGSSSSLASAATNFDTISEDGSTEDEVDPIKIKDYSNGKSANSAKLIDNEAMSTGAIKSIYYKKYLANAGGIFFILMVFLLQVSDRSIMIYNDYWLKVWSEAYGAVGNGTLLSMTPLVSPIQSVDYAGVTPSGAEMYLTMLMQAKTFAIRSIGSYRASKLFHANLIQRIVYAPMRFFDTTPIGRILNRATKDISVIDNDVMRTCEELMGGVIDALAVLAVVVAVTPAFIFGLIPMLFIYFSVSSRFLTCQREIKRLDSTTRSPIYSMFSETLVGVSTIRAYGAEERFMKENLNRVDTNHRAFFYMWSANRWFGTRVATIAGTVILVSALGTVAMKDAIGAGLAGLSLTWVLSFSDYLIWIVRIQAALEMNMNAVERVCEYSEIEQEKPPVIESSRPPANWPSKGSLVVSGLEMRYAPEQPAVLSDVSFSIQGGEKVGIVGRTGAGKSSLSLSLFRIVEPTQGRIVIDGIDISTIGLFDLRSKLTMIPQDPVLFAGTIRSNLDPFNEYDDASLWLCLKQVRFLESMQSLLKENDNAKTSTSLVEVDMSESERTGVTLDYSVTEGGNNFSQGQRQLLCLARALLKSSTLTVFDEATASVDNETDACIQLAIRGPSFAKTTVLSIAHRLRTIADYDKILVLEKGRVIQFGTPEELMTREGVFKSMCEDSGEFSELLEMARKGLSNASR